MKEIRIDDVFLSQENPRLYEHENSDDTLRLMVEDQGDKLVNLAEDMKLHGLSPIDVIAVYPHDECPNKYVVAEGNRRITAIKLLNNPYLIESINNPLFKKFLKLQDDYERITTIQAVVFANSADKFLNNWLEIRHMGEGEGRGTAKWNSIQKMRFDKKQNKENTLLDFWVELERYNILNYNEIISVTKTNWERILRPFGREYLNLGCVNGRYVIPEDEIADFSVKIKAVHHELAYKTVSVVYGTQEIEKFFELIEERVKGKIAKKKQLSFLEPQREMPPTSILNNESQAAYKINTLANEEQTSSLSNGTLPPKLPQTNSSNLRSNSKDIFNSCKTIIPATFNIKSGDARINKIIQELKFLEVDKYPNACGVLLRVLFELSAKRYVELTEGGDHTEDKFEQIISYASNKLVKENKMNKQNHSALAKDIDTIRLLFNGYAHNTNSYPSSEAIKSVFKAHKNFVCLCLE